MLVILLKLLQSRLNFVEIIIEELSKRSTSEIVYFIATIPVCKTKLSQNVLNADATFLSQLFDMQIFFLLQAASLTTGPVDRIAEVPIHA